MKEQIFASQKKKKNQDQERQRKAEKLTVLGYRGDTTSKFPR